MKWLKTIQGKIAIIVGLIGVITTLFGYMSGWFDNIVEKANWKQNIENRVSDLEDKFIESDAQDQFIYERTQDQENYQEMDWSLGKNLTEDADNNEWYYVGGDGVAHDVDIRKSKATEALWAFIYDSNQIYNIYKDRSDGRYYIILHDNKQNYYLFKKQ